MSTNQKDRAAARLDAIEEFKDESSVSLSFELPDGNVIALNTETVTWEGPVCLVSCEELEERFRRVEPLVDKCRQLRELLAIHKYESDLCVRASMDVIRALSDLESKQ